MPDATGITSIPQSEQTLYLAIPKNNLQNCPAAVADDFDRSLKKQFAKLFCKSLKTTDYNGFRGGL